VHGARSGQRGEVGGPLAIAANPDAASDAAEDQGAERDGQQDAEDEEQRLSRRP
jgi:hypothetical protein